MDGDLPGPAGPRRFVAGAALAAALAVAIYWPALRGGFVFDDDALIANNDLIKAADGLLRIWFTTQPLDYWPVTNSSFWLEWRVWGAHPVGYHATNLALHICSGLLLWMVLRRLSVRGAWLAGLIFVAHPVNVESVAWIAQRKNSLSMVFFLISAYWHLIDVSTRERDERDRSQHAAGRAKSRTKTAAGPTSGAEKLTRWYWLSLAAFVLAMLSKGSVAILPAALLLVMWWKRGAVRARDVWRLAPFFAIAVILTIVNIWFQRHYMAGAPIRDATLLQRGLGAGAVVWFYLYKAVLPARLMFVYPQWNIRVDDIRWWLPLLAAGTVTMLLWRFRHRSMVRPLFVTWVFACLALLPVMGLTDVYFMKYSLVADHYQYVAILAVAALAASAIAGATRIPSAARAGIGAVLVCVLAGLAWQQATQYVSGETLYRRTLAGNPDTWMVHSNLGLLLLDGPAPNLSEALGHFQTALALNPREPKIQNNVGVALFRLGRYAEAAEHHRAAVGLDSAYAEAHANLGADLQKLGRHREAIDAYREALRAKPDLAIVHQGLVLELLAIGRVDEAYSELQSANAAHVDTAEGHGAMGDALLQQGRTADAIAEYRRALELDPESERVLTNFGYALSAAGQLEEAERHLRRAAELNPSDAIAHDYLGNVLLDSLRLEEALREFETALRLASAADLPAIHNDIAIALAQAGRLDEAIAHLREALRLKPDFAPAKANLARIMSRK